MRRFLTGLLCMLLVLVAAGIGLFWWMSPGKIEPLETKSENGIAAIEFVEINGVTQGMMLRGQDTSNPVLLFLHGGPGSPEYTYTQKALEQLTADFTICWWEQRGSGLSYSGKIPPETMTLAQLIEDTAEVTRFLCQRFDKEQVYLMGHSWGSFLGAHTVARYPKLFATYIGVGQVADQLRSEQLGYAYMMEHGDVKLQKQLEAFTLETPVDLSTAYMEVRGNGLNALGVGITHEFTSFFSDLVAPILRSPVYTMMQKINFVRGMTYSTEYLWDVVTEERLFETVPSLQVPVYILQGAWDFQTSTVVAKEYFDALEAPDKQYHLFEHSAHSPMIEEPERFAEVLRSVLAAE